MNYWKELSLNNWKEVHSQLIGWIERNGPFERKWNEIDVVKLQLACPLLRDALRANSIGGIVRGSVYILRTPEDALIHVDNIPGETSIFPMTRLLFPILNVEGSETVFYKQLGSGRSDPTFNGGNYRPLHIFSEDEVEEDAVLRLETPVILRINTPHYVRGITAFPRITLQLCPKNELADRI